MSLGPPDRPPRRRKRVSRRLARDVRQAMPTLSVLLCFMSAAASITWAERLPLGELARPAVTSAVVVTSAVGEAYTSIARVFVPIATGGLDAGVFAPMAPTPGEDA